LSFAQASFFTHGGLTTTDLTKEDFYPIIGVLFFKISKNSLQTN
jgi:hypothetical protein